MNRCSQLKRATKETEIEVELSIDADRDAEVNKAILEQLLTSKDEIEQEFSGELEWSAAEDRRVCYIRKAIPLAGWQDEDKWPEAHEAMIDAMINLERALRPHLNRVRT